MNRPWEKGFEGYQTWPNWSLCGKQVALPEGEAFSFDGEAGKAYNFITEQVHLCSIPLTLMISGLA